MRLRISRGQSVRRWRTSLVVALVVVLLVGCGGDLTLPTPPADVANAIETAAMPTAEAMAAAAAIATGPTAVPSSTPPVGLSKDGTSEGVRLTGADRWQQAGITGKGVRVGLIEWTFNDTARFLPGAHFTVKSFRADGATVVTDESELPYGTLHGTATAEIVHEMAPDADLYLAVITLSPESFARAVDWLTTTAKVSVISFSGGWYNGYPKDGTSAAAHAVDRAKAAGVFVALSAGNKASGSLDSNANEGHYRAQYTDADNDGYHDFGGPNGVEVRATGYLRIQLDWDAANHPDAAYSFVLFAEDGVTAIDRSQPSTAPGNNVPYQVLETRVPKGTYLLRVTKDNGADLPIEIFFNGVQFGQITPESSLNLFADARGAVAVGAVNWKTDTIEPYASRGPTADGRPKPDLYAPDCTSTLAYASVGSDGFCGTSAATPHVAGAAALYKQANPTATPDDILTYFRTHAKPLPDAGHDGIPTGAARLDLGPTPSR